MPIIGFEIYQFGINTGTDGSGEATSGHTFQFPPNHVFAFSVLSSVGFGGFVATGIYNWVTVDQSGQPSNNGSGNTSDYTTWNYGITADGCQEIDFAIHARDAVADVIAQVQFWDL